MSCFCCNFPAMCNARALGGVVLLLLVVVVLHCNVVTLVSAQGSNTGPRWQTLSGAFWFILFLFFIFFCLVAEKAMENNE